MKIKNESELAYIMGSALAGYANKVQNGLTYCWVPFLEGTACVTVNVCLLEDGSLSVNPIVEETAEPEEEAQAESTTETLDEDVVVVANTNDEVLAEEPVEEVVEEPKPKRRRRTS